MVPLSWLPTRQEREDTMVLLARSLRFAIVCLLLAGATAGLHAQAGDIGKGRLNIGFEKSFAEQIRQLGIDIKYHGYRDESRHMGFSTIGGSLALATGQGEIQCKGGIYFTAGSMELEMDQLALELDATEIVVTALIRENGASLGRHRIYDVIGQIPFALPLVYGPLDSGTMHFAMDPVFWERFSKFFQIPKTTPGPTSGELRLITEFVAPLPDLAPVSLPTPGPAGGEPRVN